MSKRFDKRIIGENLDTVRKYRGITQEQLAEVMGINGPTVNRHIKTGCIDLDHLLMYGEALGVNPGEFFKDSIDRRKYKPGNNHTDHWPFNLVNAIFENQDPYCAYIPALLYVLDPENEMLTQRESEVLRCRYENEMTLEETGKYFGVGRERIRQIQAKALRRLRHPSRANLYLVVSRKQLKDTEAKLSEKEKQLDEAMKCINELREVAGLNAIDVHADLPDVPLDEMDLSVRSYNCLKRAGYTSLKMFKNISREQLMSIRHLGQKSCMEIINKLRTYGIEVEEESE